MKTNASRPVMIAAALGLVLFLAVLARATLFAPPAGPDTKGTAAQQADNAWLVQKAKECGGDFNRLALADQQKAQQMTHGKGAFVVSMTYNNFK